MTHKIFKRTVEDLINETVGTVYLVTSTRRKNHYIIFQLIISAFNENGRPVMYYTVIGECDPGQQDKINTYRKTMLKSSKRFAEIIKKTDRKLLPGIISDEPFVGSVEEIKDLLPEQEVYA